MSRPLTDWEGRPPTPASLVWRSKLDDRYLVEIQRVNESTGNLCIFDHEDDDTLIHKETVGLSYGAAFGPDAADVNTWAEAAIDVVDNPEKRNPEG